MMSHLLKFTLITAGTVITIAAMMVGSNMVVKLFLVFPRGVSIDPLIDWLEGYRERCGDEGVRHANFHR
jgi:hypothetical protein